MADQQPTSGGFTAVARMLASATGDAWTRQRVYGLWRHRGANLFPEGEMGPNITGRQAPMRIFRFADVMAWFRNYYAEQAAEREAGKERGTDE